MPGTSLNRQEKEEICASFYLYSEDELAFKYGVSKTQISNTISSYLKRGQTITDHKVEKIKNAVRAGFSVNDLMYHFGVKFRAAQNFYLAFNDKPFKIEYNPKEPYWTSEDEMIIQEYKPSDLRGWEAETYNTL